MIRSNTHAFEILETPSAEVPYKAIRYLYYQKPAQDIREKVFFWLENAYDEELLGSDSKYNLRAPLWFAILAENYLEEKLIDPLIKLYTVNDDDWDYLNEQGVLLINGLCEKLGDLAIKRFLDEIINQIRSDSEYPYLYLFDCLKYVDPTKYSKEILKLLEKKSYWFGALIAYIASMNFSQKTHPELIAQIHKELELFRLEYEMMDTFDHVDQITLREIRACQRSLSVANYPHNKKERWKPTQDWEATLRGMEANLESQNTDQDINNFDIPAPVSVPKKISRNAPCPCGSGKKYKRCCL